MPRRGTVDVRNDQRAEVQDVSGILDAHRALRRCFEFYVVC